MSTATRPTRQMALATPQTPAKRLTLADTIKGSKGLPSRLVLHGPGGIGKTSFAAYSPAPYFLLSPGETGLHTLIAANQLPEIPNLEIDSWENLIGMIDQLRTEPHDHKTLVIDTLDGMEKMLKPKVIREKFNGDDGPKGFIGFAAGDKYIAAVPWRELIMALDRLRNERHMAIIGLAHTAVVTYSNPTGPDYGRFVPDIYKDSWNLTFAWADIVLFGNFEIHSEKEKGEKRGKAVGGEVRYMATELTATADAKNRNGLTGEISMGDSGQEAWTNFSAAIKAGRSKQTQ